MRDYLFIIKKGVREDRKQHSFKIFQNWTIIFLPNRRRYWYKT